MRCVKLFVSLLFAWYASVTHAQISFQKSFGSSGYAAYGNSARQLSDSSFIIIGTNTVPGSGGNCCYLVKCDKLGDTLWTHGYGAGIISEGYSVEQTSDKGFIMVGQTNLDSTNVYVIKTNSLGDTLWTRMYGGIGRDYARSIKQTTDKGYVIAGWSTSFGAGASDVFVIKIDSAGNVSWSKAYGGSSMEFANEIEQTSDGGYIIAASSNSFGAGDFDAYVIKTDQLGNLLWSRVLGGANPDLARSISQVVNGGYILCGTTSSFGAGSYDLYVIKLDASGNTSWSKAYGGTNDDQGNSVQQTADGGYILCGYNTDAGNINWNLYLIKTDPNGDTIWTKSYREPNLIQVGNSVRQTSDRGYLICGTGIGQANYLDIYVLKTDSVGNSFCNQYPFNSLVASPVSQTLAPATQVASASSILLMNNTSLYDISATVISYCGSNGLDQIVSDYDFRIFPNPSSGVVNIQHSFLNNVQLIILNCMGRVIQNYELSSQSASLRFPDSDFIPGIYLYQVVNNGKILTKGKFSIIN